MSSIRHTPDKDSPPAPRSDRGYSESGDAFATDQQAWPSEANGGIVPPGLDQYLPSNFGLVKDDYTLDFDNWGGSPFTVGVTLITSDSILGRTALEMLASPKWNSGDKYTWVIE